MADLDAIVDVLVSAPQDTALAMDFDGTLAPIVSDPAAAEAAEGAAALLEDLAAGFGVVAVISGRRRDFLEARVGPSVALAGLYGLETRIGGQRVEHPDAADWREVIAAASGDATARTGWISDGVVVESKGLSLTVHHRGVPHREDEIAAWASEVARQTGLQQRPAKRSVELHPPVPVDKGTALEQIAGELGTICFAGDDVGDLPAYAALGRLSDLGRTTLGLGVGGAELPAEVAAAADLVLAGPEELMELLHRVAREIGVRSG